jgi:hypothetical protein
LLTAAKIKSAVWHGGESQQEQKINKSTFSFKLNAKGKQ